MIVISGCPRSGTSMMTNTVGELLKDEGYSIIGEQFPQGKRQGNFNAMDLDTQMPDESDFQFGLRKYMIQRGIDNGIENIVKAKAQHEKTKENMDKVKELNVHGFFECQYTVQGCSYHLGIDEIVGGKKISKIVSQGLPNTDPRYLNEGKVIMMVRNPKEVAKSQEGLQHPPEIQKLLEMDSDCKVHQPDMFIGVSMQASRWFLETGLEPLVIDYEEYCEDPSSHLDSIIKYLGMGNKANAEKVLDLKQKRSESQGHNTLKFNKAEKIYQMIKLSDWKGIIAEGELKPPAQVQCVRMEQRLPEVHCKGCIQGGDVARAFKQSAEEKGIKWQELPCVYECGRGTDIEHKSVEDSIANNHWQNV